MRDIVFQAEEVAQAQGALRRRCSQDARLTGETMPARLRAHPRITGESRTCRSRPLAAGSLCGAAAPREVVIGGELRTPFSLSPQPIPTEGNVQKLGIVKVRSIEYRPGLSNFACVVCCSRSTV